MVTSFIVQIEPIKAQLYVPGAALGTIPQKLPVACHSCPDRILLTYFQALLVGVRVKRGAGVRIIFQAGCPLKVKVVSTLVLYVVKLGQRGPQVLFPVLEIFLQIFVSITLSGDIKLVAPTQFHQPLRVLATLIKVLVLGISKAEDAVVDIRKVTGLFVLLVEPLVKVASGIRWFTFTVRSHDKYHAAFILQVLRFVIQKVHGFTPETNCFAFLN
mmetsp:Transcript_47561/g.79689  ORF Transcript_47561/g.79689 Transcript_47561/m.79689 type:complete len:215 (+) Transcript_47561:1082-1726(+)